ncbi:ribokinase [Polycladomyces subterraneus]|uniref:Ribokinase n=1 Tax=Polycladomyces subterraneus TaxID=1016997 RepID=A0ABT8IMK7_9BACL|nr:ribokinase [Polycladomyces subterraneus]MDN4593983.1 ribokinase [Polycladomyces subterraneus]
MGKIVVVGSSSIDLVVTSPKRPIAGETVIGETFHIVPGGKGANQAVAAARAGAEVEMVGAVGNDQFGDMVLDNFQKQGVSTTYMKPVTHKSTGIAHIVIAEEDNSIVVVPGANSEVDRGLVDRAKEAIKAASVVLLQLEIPLDTVMYVADLCKKWNVPVILNPAPATILPPDLIEKVTYLTPNEHECRAIFKDCVDVEEILKRYPNKIIMSEGSQGARYFDGDQFVRVPALSVDVVDTTGAGDTFNGVFAVALAQGLPLKQAIRYGCVAASLSVTKLGAQGGMPTMEEILKHVGDEH